jgi:hypothetical protein
MIGIDQGKRPSRQQCQEARADTDFNAQPASRRYFMAAGVQSLPTVSSGLSNSGVQRDSLPRRELDRFANAHQDPRSVPTA